MASDKFSNELDIEKLLMKLRDSYDLTKNMVKKDYRELLAYQRGRVIDPSESDEESNEEQVAGADQELQAVNEFMKLAVVKGMVVDKTLKSKLREKIRKKEQIDKFKMILKDKVTKRNVDQEVEMGMVPSSRELNNK